MFTDDKKSVTVIDFGISSVIAEGNTILVTHTGMTPEYSAPETFRNLFLEESDYYSFGITLYELFCGYTPYKNMKAEEIAQFTAVQRIPFPKDMPQELRELISALTYYDITNRNQKDHPNRRWTYEEVINWCEGKPQIIPGEQSNQSVNRAIPSYSFMGHDYQDIPSLVTALATHWNKGKKQLYQGLLSAYFQSFHPEFASYCIHAEIAASNESGKDDLIFWQLLYQIYPECNGFYWMGQIYESLPALGRDILERLWRKDSSNYRYWDHILEQRLLTHYLVMVKSKNQHLIEAVSALETAHQLKRKTKHDTLMNYYMMAYLLSGQKLLRIKDKQLKNVSELVAYMKQLLDSSYQEFADFCHDMVDYEDQLDVQFEAWLIALGKRKELESWRRSLKASQMKISI